MSAEHGGNHFLIGRPQVGKYVQQAVAIGNDAMFIIHIPDNGYDAAAWLLQVADVQFVTRSSIGSGNDQKSFIFGQLGADVASGSFFSSDYEPVKIGRAAVRERVCQYG